MYPIHETEPEPVEIGKTDSGDTLPPNIEVLASVSVFRGLVHRQSLSQTSFLAVSVGSSWSQAG